MKICIYRFYIYKTYVYRKRAALKLFLNPKAYLGLSRGSHLKEYVGASILGRLDVVD